MALQFSGILNYPSFSPSFFFKSGIGTVNLFTTIFASLSSTWGARGLIHVQFGVRCYSFQHVDRRSWSLLWHRRNYLTGLVSFTVPRVGDLPPNCSLPGKGSQFCADQPQSELTPPASSLWSPPPSNLRRFCSGCTGSHCDRAFISDLVNCSFCYPASNCLQNV